MSLTIERKTAVIERLKVCLINKFNNYRPETENMPFHYRLLGKDRMALFSFIQSLNTTFGSSIYEPIALELAEGRFKRAQMQVNPNNLVSSGAQRKIQEIMDEITTARREPNSKLEIAEIREVCQEGDVHTVTLRKFDIFLEGFDGSLHFMDIKTVKPNIGGFEDYKRMLLTWVAAELQRNPNIEVHPYIAIPYNPYEPNEYNRWTMRGIFDLSKEVLVATEMWDFIGGIGSYKDLLDCFEIAGTELRPIIDHYFERFK
ncbi:MAG: TdeIII family type II restriction endonuclease [Anaerolinea sp.]|nr:TdeIII family type II restriction endonuclease [Anaerolinea sp.]